MLENDIELKKSDSERVRQSLSAGPAQRVCRSRPKCVVSPQARQEGRGGRWGLEGMWERATRIGALLTISISTTAGTEAQLSVPRSLPSIWNNSAYLFGHLGERILLQAECVAIEFAYAFGQLFRRHSILVVHPAESLFGQPKLFILT